MAIKILCVDDEKDLELLIRQKFRSQIKKNIYEFVFALNGLEALAKLMEHPDTRIILCDINMPEMDGITLLAKINEMRNPAMKTIMVSAYGDMGNIRAAMNEGAFDFTTKPIDFADLERTISNAVEQIEYIQRAEESKEKLVTIERDLKIATEIQQAILPRNFSQISNDLMGEIYGMMKAARSVGGDFYDFFMIDDQHLGIVIADVSDKGIAAAIYMAVSRTIIHTTALRGVSPSKCLEIANNILSKDNTKSMFVTVFYGILDIQTGELEYCNAGHNLPCFIKQNNGVAFVESTNDMAIGVFPNVDYHNGKIQLSAGDMLFLYTDGITEAMNKTGDLYSDERLLTELNNLEHINPKFTIESIDRSVSDFTLGTEQSDDQTMLAVSL